MLGVAAFAQAGEEGGRKAPAPAAVTEPGPRLPIGRPQAVAQQERHEAALCGDR